MLDIGEISVSGAIAPTRATTNGSPAIGRLSTSEEQRAEALEQMRVAAQDAGESELKARVTWSRGEPTTLEVRFSVEHIDGEEVRLVDQVLEYVASGAEVRTDDEARLRILKDEVAELHERGML